MKYISSLSLILFLLISQVALSSDQEFKIEKSIDALKKNLELYIELNKKIKKRIKDQTLTNEKMNEIAKKLSSLEKKIDPLSNKGGLLSFKKYSKNNSAKNPAKKNTGNNSQNSLDTVSFQKQKAKPQHFVKLNGSLDKNLKPSLKNFVIKMDYEKSNVAAKLGRTNLLSDE